VTARRRADDGRPIRSWLRCGDCQTKGCC
jgi:hypothetical protein